MAEPTAWRRWLARAFPRVPDFHTPLAAQCAAVEESLAALAVMVARDEAPVAEGPDARAAEAALAAVERRAEENAHLLSRAFATPYDREDIHRAIEELTWIAEHLSRFAHELVILELAPDAVMAELLDAVRQGVAGLHLGFLALGEDRRAALQHAGEARAAHRHSRAIYERALGALLRPDHDLLDAIKRREVYHHLTDGAHRVRKAAGVLSDIVIKDPD